MMDEGEKVGVGWGWPKAPRPGRAENEGSINNDMEQYTDVGCRYTGETMMLIMRK